MRSPKVILLLIILVFEKRDLSAQTDTVSVFFPMDQHTLTSAAKARIDSLIYFDRINNRSKFAIIGYADYVGGPSSNKTLSEDRANAVANYIASYDIPKANITMLEGKGEVERTDMSGSSGFQPDRRVDIVLHYQRTPPPAPKPQAPPAPAPAPKPKEITQVEVGQTMVLENIYFYPGQHFVRQESMPTLNELKKTLDAHPGLRIRIEGHICCQPNLPETYDGLDLDEGTYNLSANRAQFIYDWLVEQGIDADRLESVGLARRNPLVDPEITPADGDKNRRVEIRVISK